MGSSKCFPIKTETATGLNQICIFLLGSQVTLGFPAPLVVRQDHVRVLSDRSQPETKHATISPGLKPPHAQAFSTLAFPDSQPKREETWIFEGPGTEQPSTAKSRWVEMVVTEKSTLILLSHCASTVLLRRLSNLTSFTYREGETLLGWAGPRLPQRNPS